MSHLIKWQNGTLWIISFRNAYFLLFHAKQNKTKIEYKATLRMRFSFATIWFVAFKIGVFGWRTVVAFGFDTFDIVIAIPATEFTTFRIATLWTRKMATAAAVVQAIAYINTGRSYSTHTIIYWSSDDSFWRFWIEIMVEIHVYSQILTDSSLPIDVFVHLDFDHLDLNLIRRCCFLNFFLVFSLIDF